MVKFNEWLNNRDKHLYNEINAQDMWNATKYGVKKAKDTWDITGKAVGKKARNAAAGVALGTGALAYGLSGDPGVELVSKHNNMDIAQVQQLKQNEPDYYQSLLSMAKLERDVHGLNQSIDKGMGRSNQAEPKDGYNWQAPGTHYQSPFFDRENARRKPSTKDTMDSIDQILRKK